MNDSKKEKPFHKVEEFDVMLRCGEETFGPAKCYLSYSLVRSDKINGVITAYNKTSKDIFEIYVQQGYKCSLRSIIGKPANENALTRKLTAEKIEFSTVRNIGESKKYGGALDAVEAQFSTEEFCTEDVWPEQSEIKREIQFFLDGPKIFWSRMTWRESSLDSGVVIEKDYSVDIDLGFNAKIEIAEIPFIDTSEVDGLRTTLKIGKVVIIFRTVESKEKISDMDFVNLTTQAAEDMSMVASFASREPIRWYMRRFYTSTGSTETVRHIHYKFSQELEREKMLIEPMRGKDFLKVAVEHFRTLSKQGIDLKDPLLFLPTEDMYIEEQFMLCYQSLEKLKDLWAKSKKYHKIASEGDFERIKETIEQALDTKCANIKESELSRNSHINILSWVKDKITELNRPTFWGILRMLLETYEIQWKDLYPPNPDMEQPPFINTRNKLFHTSNKIDGNILLKDTFRVRIVVERLLLKLLEWKGNANFSPSYVMSYLCQKPEEER